MSDKVHGLIGDLTLDGALTELGRVAREVDAAAGWGACHWPNRQADANTLRGKTDEAMRLLDDFATQADVGFQSTHTGSLSGIAIRAAAAVGSSSEWAGHIRWLILHGA